MEEKDLIKKYREGSQKALEEIFINNENLIHYVYNRYFKLSGCPKEDMFQEGCLGLMEAILRFDESKSLKSAQFNYFKVKWIKKKMFDFRGKYFRHPSWEILNDHKDIESLPTSSEKMRMALFELDNLVKAGILPKFEAEKLLKKIVKGTR